MEDLRRDRLEDIEGDVRQRERWVHPGPVRVRTASHRSRNRWCGGQGRGIRGERQVPVLDRVCRNGRVRGSRACQHLVLTRRGIAAPILALVEREAAHGHVDVQVVVPEAGERPRTCDRDARRAGERAYGRAALLEVRAGGECGRRRESRCYEDERCCEQQASHQTSLPWRDKSAPPMSEARRRVKLYDAI